MTEETRGPGNHSVYVDGGMTIRDYFAAKAMQTLLQTNNGAVGVNRYEHRIAETAYAVADAMLKARER